MARIKKVTKMTKGINLCNEEIADKKFQRNVLDVNNISRKLCNNDKNRRILLNLKSYPNFFLKNNLLPATRKYAMSVSTQTADNGSFDEGRQTISTQTNIKEEKDKKVQETSLELVRQTKSDCSLVRPSKLNSKNSHNAAKGRQISLEKIKQCENKKKQENIIILHKNRNMDNPELSELGNKIKINNTMKRKVKKYNRSICTKKRTVAKFHSYKINRKLRKTKELEKNNVCTNTYHQLIKKIGKYSLTAVAEYSSKLIRIFSDLGLSLTESLTNLYKFYESQKCQTLKHACKCHDFNLKIDQLMIKLNQLEDSFQISQAKLKEQQKKIDVTYEFAKNLEDVTKKLESYDLIKSELSTLKKQLAGNSDIPKIISKPPPPPPLPPLPIFSLTTNCASKTFLKVVQNERKLINCESSRPIITLEDILNVKLKKISVTNI